MNRRRLSRPVRAAGIALLVLAGFFGAPRSAAAQDAGSFVAKLGSEAIQVSGASVPSTERTARFRQLIGQDFDMLDITRFVLGPNRHKLTPAQQQEFLSLFRESLVRAYSRRLAEYSGEPFRVTGSRPNGDGAIVTSRVSKHDGKPVELDWHLVNRDGRFLITDVAIDGVSMKVSQRQTFAGIIERNGGRADSLLAVLRQELAQTRAG